MAHTNRTAGLALALLLALAQSGSAVSEPMAAAHPGGLNQPLAESRRASDPNAEALAALEQGRFAQAVELAGQRVALAPEDARAHLILVLGWVAQRNDRAVDDHLQSLQQQYPRMAWGIRAAAADLYASRGDVSQAQRQIAGIPARERNARLLKLAGSLYRQQQQYTAALQAYMNATALVPEDPETLLAIVTLNLHFHRYEAAARWTDELLERAPDYPEGLAIADTVRLKLEQSRYAGASTDTTPPVLREQEHLSISTIPGLDPS